MEMDLSTWPHLPAACIQNHARRVVGDPGNRNSKLARAAAFKVASGDAEATPQALLRLSLRWPAALWLTRPWVQGSGKTGQVPQGIAIKGVWHPGTQRILKGVTADRHGNAGSLGLLVKVAVFIEEGLRAGHVTRGQ